MAKALQEIFLKVETKVNKVGHRASDPSFQWMAMLEREERTDDNEPE